MNLKALLTATLALSPALLHAQPLTAAADSNATGTDHTVRVSTGVVPPRLVHSIAIPSDMDWQWKVAGPERTTEVSMTVDASGKPTNLKIVKSAGVDLDRHVLEAVGQYRFTPATVSNQAAPMDVDLTLNIVKPTSWDVLR
jgi:TonB family protein